MNIRWTEHAKTVVAERRLDLVWIHRVLDSPERTEDHEDGTRHFLGRIAERENRVLRVVTNPATDPPTLVTAFFDRRMRGRLT